MDPNNKENQDSSDKPRTLSLGSRLRHLSGDLLKKTPKERMRNPSGDIMRAHRNPPGEALWDLSGERIRNVSGDSCSSATFSVENTSKVMIALDDSKHSEQTVHYYLRHVHRKDNDVILAHVIELPENASEAMHSMLSRETIDKMWTEGITKAEAAEKKYATILQEAGIDHVHIRNESGLKPGHALCSLAEQEGVNMIVMGSRDEGKIRRTLLGSVSDYIVHHAPCPVLVCTYSRDGVKGGGSDCGRKRSKSQPNGAKEEENMQQ